MNYIYHDFIEKFDKYEKMTYFTKDKYSIKIYVITMKEQFYPELNLLRIILLLDKYEKTVFYSRFEVEKWISTKDNYASEFIFVSKKTFI